MYTKVSVLCIWLHNTQRETEITSDFSASEMQADKCVPTNRHSCSENEVKDKQDKDVKMSGTNPPTLQILLYVLDS